MGQYVMGAVLGMGSQGDMGVNHHACLQCAVAPMLHTIPPLTKVHEHIPRPGLHMRTDDLLRRQLLPRRHALLRLTSRGNYKF